MTTREEGLVFLECVRDPHSRTKLRVRILSPGYYHDANCMFPRAIRQLGRRYSVDRGGVRLITRASKYYYSVSGDIKIIESAGASASASVPLHIETFEDKECAECAICFANAKDTVIGPCGHFYTCKTCADTLFATSKLCPICRGPIVMLIAKENVM